MDGLEGSKGTATIDVGKTQVTEKEFILILVSIRISPARAKNSPMISKSDLILNFSLSSKVMGVMI